MKSLLKSHTKLRQPTHFLQKKTALPAKKAFSTNNMAKANAALLGSKTFFRKPVSLKMNNLKPFQRNLNFASAHFKKAGRLSQFSHEHSPFHSARNSHWLGFGLGLLLAAGTYSTYKAYAEEHPVAFDSSKFQKFPVKEIQPINHNTKLIRFSLPSENHQMGMNVASFILTKAPIGEDGKAIVRPYTPTSENADYGFFDLVVKKYETGAMSSHIHSLGVGDELEVKGPIQKLPYAANKWENITMIAGGSGLTPMLQVLNEIAKNPNDKTKVTLLFANVAEEDILLKDRLDNLAKSHSNITVKYILEKPPKNWDGPTGYINKDLLKKTLAPPSDSTMILVCGPPGMVSAISGPKAKDFSQGEIGGALKDLGYQEKHVYKF